MGDIDLLRFEDLMEIDIRPLVEYVKYQLKVHNMEPSSETNVTIIAECIRNIIFEILYYAVTIVHYKKQYIICYDDLIHAIDIAFGNCCSNFYIVGSHIEEEFYERSGIQQVNDTAEISDYEYETEEDEDEESWDDNSNLDETSSISSDDSIFSTIFEIRGDAIDVVTFTVLSIIESTAGESEYYLSNSAMSALQQFLDFHSTLSFDAKCDK